MGIGACLRVRLLPWLALCLLLGTAGSPAADQDLVGLSLRSPGAVAPGGTVTVDVALRISPGWHIYWVNAGDSGLPLRPRWTLPPGWTASPWRSPVPERIEALGMVDFVHHGEVLYRADLQAPLSATAGEVIVGLEVRYLACKEACLPGSCSGSVVQRIDPAAPATVVPPPATHPVEPARAGVTVSAVRSAAGVMVEVRGRSLPPPPSFPLIPADEGAFALAAAQVRSASADTWRLQLVSATGAAVPERLRAVLVGIPDVAGVALDVPVTGAETVATPSAAPPGVGLLGAVTVGLLGGLLLNLMPCVLPVLALKVLAVNRARAAGQPLLGQALAYAAGVIAAYLALALVLLAIRAGGGQVGWGFQLQQPAVVLALTALFVLLAINLAGVFEIGLAATRVDAGRGGSGLGGAVLNGVLTTVVATPCGAPFVSTALAFAVVAPVAESLAVFCSLGVGLALPVVLVAAVPGIARWMPRPGPWMEDLKRLLAIPMLGAAGWMAWTYVALAGGESSFAVLVFGLPLLVLAGGAWGRVQGGGGRVAMAVAVASLLAAVAVGGWAVTQVRGATAAAASHGWEPWSEVREGQLRAAGTPFLIDYTAAWCLTCQVNKRTTLHDPALLADLAARGVVTLRADFTGNDPAVARSLASHGRASVPTYVLSTGAGKEDILLPDLLTIGLVREAIAGVPPRAP